VCNSLDTVYNVSGRRELLPSTTHFFFRLKLTLSTKVFFAALIFKWRAAVVEGAPLKAVDAAYPPSARRRVMNTTLRLLACRTTFLFYARASLFRFFELEEQEHRLNLEPAFSRM